VTSSKSALLCATALLAAGCVTLGRVDIANESCAESFRARLAEILVAEGEAPPIADEVADRTMDALLGGDEDPADFVTSSPSGATYAFLVQKKEKRCLLRLYFKRRRHVEITNNLTYIATRPLPDCACE
jgi:hypothetical protein